ncbi:MAG: hypothetical protein AABY07_10575 [Nanoarchaeota archaeon]
MENFRDYDLKKLEELYDALPKDRKLPGCEKGKDFLELVFSRRDIMSKGEDLSSFITKEIHFSLDLRGFNFVNGAFVPRISCDGYLKLRDSMLQALIKKAFDITSHNSNDRNYVNYSLEFYHTNQPSFDLIKA